MTTRFTRNRGFSLIELMIAVAIVGILAAIAYPAYTDQIAKGRRAECRGGLLQSMQQQERYFTQYNSYTAFTAGDTAAKTKSFSGDNQEKSACTIEAIACTAPSNTAVTQCIELRAATRYTDPVGIGYLYIDAEGRKGCTKGGTSTRVSDTKDCWP